MQELPVLSVYKQLGKTPLEVIRKVQQVYPEYATTKIGYAGRLDPMAEGVLLLLLGDENKHRKRYETLPKSYHFSFLLGIATDSYDLLGKVTAATPHKTMSKKTVEETLSSLVGNFLQQYPPYSSVHVKGKPLFYWARENSLKNITIPKKKITITDIQLISSAAITATQLQGEINKRITLVSGDFRQEEIKQSWNSFFTNNTSRHFSLLSCAVTCSSGTYIRSLVVEIGKKLAVPTTTFSITRTAVGQFMLADCLHAFEKM